MVVVSLDPDRLANGLRFLKGSSVPLGVGAGSELEDPGRTCHGDQQAAAYGSNKEGYARSDGAFEPEEHDCQVFLILDDESDEKYQQDQ